MTTLITKFNSIPTNVPSVGNMQVGELAVNTFDRRLFTKDAGVIVEIGTKPSLVNGIVVGQGLGSNAATNVVVGLSSGGIALGAKTTIVGSVTSGSSTGANTTAIGYGNFNDLTTGANNVAIGALTGWGITTGAGNVIIGNSVSGLATALTNNIILADGVGNIRAQHDGSQWTLTGSLSLPAGQIKFPAAQNASTDANTLDDYEEGTWTPIDGSTAGLAFTSNTGTYTKVGRLVTASYRLIYPTTTNAAAALVAGLPFSANIGFPTGFTGYNGAVGVVINHRLSGTTGFQVSNAATGGDVTNLTMSAKEIQGTFIYMTS